MPRTLLCTDCDATFPHKEGETRCPSCGFGRIVDADNDAFCLHAWNEHDVYGEVCTKCGDHRSIPIANT